jgi:hypothetical protein
VLVGRYRPTATLYMYVFAASVSRSSSKPVSDAVVHDQRPGVLGVSRSEARSASESFQENK